jgi:hypothetical protein
MEELDRFTHQMEQAAKASDQELQQQRSVVKKQKESLQLLEMWRWQAEDTAKHFEQDLRGQREAN